MLQLLKQLSLFDEAKDESNLGDADKLAINSEPAIGQDELDKQLPATSSQRHADSLEDYSEIMRDYQLIRTRRKTLSLEVVSGSVVVRAPMRAPKYWIEQTIDEKRHWIIKQLKNQAKQNQQIIRITHNSAIDINDQRYRICYCYRQQTEHCPSRSMLRKSNRKGKLILDNGTFHILFPYQSPVENHQALATQLFLQWLKAEAANLLRKHVDLYCKKMDCQEKISGLRFRMTKTAWGHCTSEGVVQLNPSIALLPSWVRDYVIVHELAHLSHRDHSKRFWRRVARFYPRWQQAERWLKQEGHRVAIGSNF